MKLSEKMRSKEPMKSWDAGDCISDTQVEDWADEVALLEGENESLKTELRGERERLLLEMYNNDTISQVQFDHAMKELALLPEEEKE